MNELKEHNARYPDHLVIYDGPDPEDWYCVDCEADTDLDREPTNEDAEPTSP